MEVLNQHIRKNGYDYYLVHRTEQVAMYHQMDGEAHVAYEVFKIKIQRPRIFIDPKSEKEIQFPLKELFPSDESFGKHAWTYYHYENALKKYNELLPESSSLIKPM